MAASTNSSSLDSASAENFVISSSAVESVMEETSSSEPETENGGVRTVINSLKAPAPSQLARKRKIHSNPPTGVKRRTTTVKADYEPKSVTLPVGSVSFLESILLFPLFVQPAENLYL